MERLDPLEERWWQAFVGAIASGSSADASRAAADDAIALLVKRWPRGRDVVPLAEHNEEIEQERALAKGRVRTALGWMAQGVREAWHRSAYDASRDSPDADAVMTDFVTALCAYANRDDAGMPGVPIPWSPPARVLSERERLCVRLVEDLGTEEHRAITALADLRRKAGRVDHMLKQEEIARAHARSIARDGPETIEQAREVLAHCASVMCLACLTTDHTTAEHGKAAEGG